MIGKTFIAVNSTVDLNGVHTVRLLPEGDHENPKPPKGVVALAGVPEDVTAGIEVGKAYEVVFIPVSDKAAAGPARTRAPKPKEE